MKQIISTLLILTLPYTIFGQAVFHGLTSNPQLFHTKINDRDIQTTDTLQLPFIDDFSYNSSSPTLDLWLDQNVFINNNFANKPPSVGVATFDVLDQNGLLYDTADVSSFTSDFLTSKPIDLSSYTAADSIYLSFFYQPKGNGWDSPDQDDSLVLQFQTSKLKWHSIWAKAGTPLTAFQQIMIPVLDTAYHKADFQFRFFNYATLGGSQNQEDAISNDFWNLDMVVMDTARTINNPYFDDVAFYSFNTSLFYDYYAVPWKHYKLSAMRVDSVDYNLNNLDNATNNYNHLTYLLYQDESLLLDSFDMGGNNIAALSTVEKLFSQAAMSGTPGYNNIPTQLYDSTQFTVERYFVNPDTSFAGNDTVRYTQYFYNQYAYDDGTAESGFSLIGNEARYAFKITALTADTLRGLSMMFNRYKDYGTADESSFSLCVWKNNEGKPGDLIYQENNIRPKYTTGKDAFSTYKFIMPILADTTFFVGWTNDTRKVYNLGYDFNNTNQEQVFVDVSGYWEALPQGMPMIRAIMGDDFEDVSVAEIDSHEQLQIFPNPTQGTITVQTQSKSPSQVRVYSSTGLLLISKNIRQSESFKLKEYGSGLYIIMVLTGKQSISKKIIVL